MSRWSNLRVEIETPEWDSSGRIIGVNRRRVRFANLTDRQKLTVIAEALGCYVQHPDPSRGCRVPKSIYFAHRRYIFAADGSIKSIVDYRKSSVGPPDWVEEDE